MLDFHITSTLEQCKVIQLGKHHHDNGNLTVVEDNNEIPFKIKRTFYLYDIPGGEDRGGHSHRTLYQFIIAISGSFDVKLDDGVSKKTVTLNRPYEGLLVVPGIWDELCNFSSGSVCAVIVSDVYQEKDYVRNYQEFIRLTAGKNKM